MIKKCIALFITMILSIFLFIGCGNSAVKNENQGVSLQEEAPEKAVQEKAISEAIDGDVQETTIMVAAAASLEYSFEERLIPMFIEQNPGTKIQGVYDASGKLQTQIEEGLEADVFMSAATKQMNELLEKGLIDESTIIELLENKIVLIVSSDLQTDISSFLDITKSDTIAIGDPESVPVGQYSQEALTSIGIWDEIQDKISLGTNVTEVLNWVAESSAETGIVYATDAATTDRVKIIAEAPDNSLEKKVIYPVGVLKSSAQKDIAEKFVKFLESDEALAIFEEYGFTPNTVVVP